LKWLRLDGGRMVPPLGSCPKKYRAGFESGLAGV
jgi:hypothetical protein